MADGDYYSAKQDMYNIFGKDNIRKWADADNQSNGRIVEDREDWANQMAQVYLNGRLLYSKYTIPFTAPYPPTIILIAASYAGILLYETREVISGSKNTSVPRQKKNYEKLIRQILRGQLRITTVAGVELALIGEVIPKIIKQKTDDSQATVVCSPFFLNQS